MGKHLEPHEIEARDLTTRLYRDAQEQAQTDTQRQRLREMRATVYKFAKRRMNPDRIHEQPTILDLRAFLEKHPEEARLSDEDRKAIEQLPAEVRERILKLIPPDSPPPTAA